MLRPNLLYKCYSPKGRRPCLQTPRVWCSSRLKRCSLTKIVHFASLVFRENSQCLILISPNVKIGKSSNLVNAARSPLSITVSVAVLDAHVFSRKLPIVFFGLPLCALDALFPYDLILCARRKSLLCYWHTSYAFVRKWCGQRGIVFLFCILMRTCYCISPTWLCCAYFSHRRGTA